MCKESDDEIGANAEVLNHWLGVGLLRHGLPVTIMLPNCGKSPEMKVAMPVTCQPPSA